MVQRIPCGQCVTCQRKKASHWVTRLKMEAKEAKTAFFVTLTYSEENVPRTEINGEVIRVLHKPDIQKFFKRLLKKQSKLYPDFGKIRRYYVGEYGERTYRPHYHAIIFGMHPDMRKYLIKLWKNGVNIKCDELQDGQVAYAAMYQHKKTHMPKLVAQLRENDYARYKKLRPFTAMSNRSGIGAAYADKYKEQYRKLERLYITESGYKKGMPRYIRERIFTEEELEYLLPKAKEAFDKMYQDQLDYLSRCGYDDPEKEMIKRQVLDNKQHIAKIKRNGNI